MLQSEQIGDLVAALAKAQTGLTAPPRNREVEVVSKRTGGRYKFKYATLDAIIEHVRPALTANGLWFVQTIANGDGKYRLVTKLLHSSGQWLASETPILTTSGDNQEFGSAITYMKRYSLAAMLGIAADEDDDANAADGNTVEASNDRKPAPKQTKTEQVKAQTVTGVDAWLEKARAHVSQMPDRIVLNGWLKEAATVKALEKMKSDHTEKYDDFQVFLDKTFDSLPAGKAAA